LGWVAQRSGAWVLGGGKPNRGLRLSGWRCLCCAVPCCAALCLYIPADRPTLSLLSTLDSLPSALSTVRRCAASTARLDTAPGNTTRPDTTRHDTRPTPPTPDDPSPHEATRARRTASKLPPKPSHVSLDGSASEPPTDHPDAYAARHGRAGPRDNHRVRRRRLRYASLSLRMRRGRVDMNLGMR
jgi:hypothetical protein